MKPEQEVKQVYNRKGRRSKQEIADGVEQYRLFSEEGDREATRLYIRGRRGGKPKYDC